MPLAKVKRPLVTLAVGSEAPCSPSEFASAKMVQLVR